eukprot:EC800135.1.p1 GENE.EC800135.1~~EC800135.1.p1  ORF type:complete len:153 (+),score=33.52 EC800135.1:195-653(+)
MMRDKVEADPALFTLNAVVNRMPEDDLLKWLSSNVNAELESDWVTRRIVHAFLLGMLALSDGVDRNVLRDYEHVLKRVISGSEQVETQHAAIDEIPEFAGTARFAAGDLETILDALLDAGIVLHTSFISWEANSTNSSAEFKAWLSKLSDDQ